MASGYRLAQIEGDIVGAQEKIESAIKRVDAEEGLERLRGLLENFYGVLGHCIEVLGDMKREADT